MSPSHDDALRAAVDAAIRRHLERRAGTPAPAPTTQAPRQPGHPSHLLLTLPTGGDDGTACLIEPAVACVHCGYCRSLGY